MTFTARTDFESIPISKVPAIPEIGSVAHDPDFNTSILRVTGPGFNPQHPDFAYGAGIGGSADENVWNKDSTKFVFEDQGNRVFIMGFDPVNFKTFPLFPGVFPQGTFGIPGGGRGIFSHQGDIFFEFDGTKINQYDFSLSPIVPPAAKLVYDFGAVMPGFTSTWQSIGGASADSQTFAIALSNSGGQGTGTTIMVYRVGKGWRRFETHTGIVTGQWGTIGKMVTKDHFTIHNIKLSPGGDYLVVAVGIVDDALAKNKHFWNIDTLQLTEAANFTAGHFTEGYTHWVNNGGVPFGQYSSRLFTAPTASKNLITPMPKVKIIPRLDSHLSWNNVGPADEAPFFATTTSTNTTWQTWQHEVLGFQNGKVYRFCHTFNTGSSPLFSTANAIGCVSQDGKFMLFSSDWQGQTKGDIFIVALK